MLTKTIYKTYQQVQVLRRNFLSARHYYVNLQFFLYAAVITPMKLRKLVVDRIWVEHGLFCSSRKCQSQKTGSYTVNTSLACFQWLLVTLFLRPIKLEKETLYQDLIRSVGQKRGNTSYTIFILLKTLILLLTYN